MRVASPTNSDDSASARNAGTRAQVIRRTTSPTPMAAMVRRVSGVTGKCPVSGYQSPVSISNLRTANRELRFSSWKLEAGNRQLKLINLWFSNGGRAFEEVEVAAAIGLRDVQRIEMPEAARVLRFGPFPLGAPARQLRIVDAQRETARGNVELDDVAVAHEREGAPDERFRSDVEHAGAVAGSAHARVG